MQGEIVATGLEFPEGPLWHQGSLYFTEIQGGVISLLEPGGGVRRVAETGGGPNGAAVGRDGTLYVTQNGIGRAGRTTAGIQRVTLDGEVTMLATSAGGIRLDAPNDLAFGPDGRLYFTDPRGHPDPAADRDPGRLFALDIASGAGELIVELGPVFPNGIGFDSSGSLLWTESFSRRVMRLVDGRPEVVIELPERHAPDGLAVGSDGRLYVASTFAHCVSVVDGDEIVERYVCGDGMVTNCCFAGRDLYVTESRRGTLWRFALGIEGVQLH